MPCDLPCPISVPEYNQYKSLPFISNYDFTPFKDGWYFTLVEEDERVYGRYVEFLNGSWINASGSVLYWMENY